MNILIVPSWYQTETSPLSGIFFREQAEALQRRGLRVAVAFADLHVRMGGLRTGFYREENTPVPTFVYRRRSLTPFVEAGRWLQRRQMLERLYQEVTSRLWRPDIVQLHSCQMAVETAWLCTKHHLPLVYTEHFSGVLGKKSAPLRREMKTALRYCSAAIAVSEALRNALSPYRDDVAVIPNMVDTGRFSPRESPHAGFVFAAMGNLVPIKGFDRLIDAFSLAAENMPGAVLKIAGGGIEEQHLRARIAAHHLDERIILIGPVSREKAPDFFNGCDCFVCSSRAETFGAVLIEALACGKPVLSTRCGGPESILDTRNGVLCDNGGQQPLGRGLLAMYQRARSYDAAQIRSDCVERFGEDAVCSRLEQIYRSVLPGKDGDRSR